ncbi:MULTISPECIES: NADH-quinone oxidoreductase subunit A [Francisella]|uniref:NADH-quinone oxidoreductase subunit A n=6 Tax=Francisella TaxID=262 RepID=Q5NIN5_FRATT|nr:MULTISPECIES: NADH-quinone oxidoreductase subunit A [Francisella]AAV29690.1 NT02FT1736 [synthetic construct]ACD30194.1 NADH dehydrogenase I, A subunit [Francisella tularensis subsp. mediasiatica FSC147]ABK90537.1 NADH dehydrogenase I, A subunit [Francisella tularensis subsp. novicida U112]ABO46094.1 NADH dehydrogenase I subunit A [Francisella tularensis subsp. tularensis WY96-3418]ADA77710.1 NADH dehydrogenase I subunit A [Francisella tularensis subsp. tularensis NE061598]
MSTSVYEQFAPILIFLIIAFGLGAAFAIIGKVLSVIVGANNPNKTKGETFECGFPTFGDAREKLDVRFYLIAVLFLVFDLELAFIIPWGINLRASAGMPAISDHAFFAMIIFLVVLFLGLIYAWKKGALEWE